MKNVKKIITLIFIALLSGACTNYFHDLIPPDDNRILSFEVDGQIGAAVISNNTVSAFVEKGTDINSAIPRISVSNKAVLLPATFDYVMSAFPSADLYKTAMQMNTSEDITSFVMDMIRENPDFNIPALDLPIDFSGPVTMLVVSGQGSIRQYTVELTVDTGEPRLLNFSFSKYDNAELVIDSRCVINEADRTVTANAMYPIEMDYLSFKLIPSFQIQGESLSIDGVNIDSGVTEAQFTPFFGSQNKTIRVTRNGETKDYTLIITFAEDPDTIRSITDFRFNKIDNPGIAANAVASIINTDNTGTIIVQVFYAGAKPSVLTPRFISPGRVSVGGIAQTSGVSGHDFSSQTEYRVVSKNGLYTRTYTVKVEFVSLTDGAPRITAFRFSSALNLELVQDAAGEISDGLIMIEVRYGGAYSPISLIPEFSAEGLVTVYGSVQVSGASPQDFVRQIKYTVTNPINPLFTRDYWVQCRMIRDTSSEALITSFGFYPEDNAGLADEIIGKIDQINKKITVYAPVGSGITSRTMFPRFTAAGQVNVGGTAQVSGVSGRIFDAPVTYTVVSANGMNSKSYAVTVRELQTTIYVDCNAFGHGDGLNWENAFRTLKQACEAAAQFPTDTPKEIWIAKGTYKPGSSADDYFPLSANTSYIGGFAGHETAKSQRNVEANPVIISGDTGAGAYSKRLFSSAHALNGDLSFDSLQFTGAANGGGINAALGSFDVLNITNCTFDNLKVSDSGGAVYVRGGGAVISNSAFNLCNGGAVFVQGTTADIRDSKFSMCTGGDVLRLDCSGETDITRVTVEDSSAINLSGNGGKTLDTVSVKRGGGVSVRNSEGNLRITSSDLTDITGYGISIDNLSGNAEIISLNLRNISNYGIYCYNSSPDRVRLSGITINDASGGRAVSLTLTHGAIFLENSNFTNREVYLKTGSSSLVDVSNTNITSVTSGDALVIAGGNNVTVENVTINGVSVGNGLYMSGLGGNAEVTGLDLRDISGYGIYCSGSPNRARLSGITGNNVRGNHVVSLSLTKGAIILENSNFTNGAGVSISTDASSAVEVSNCGINAVTSGDALAVDAAYIAIDRVNIDGVPNGRGMDITNNGKTEISNTVIKNCVTEGNGGGINMIGAGSAVIFFTTITECEANAGMYLACSGNVNISNTTIDTVTLTDPYQDGGGGGIYHINGSLTVENSVIKNITGHSNSSGIWTYSENLEVSGLELQNINGHGIVILCENGLEYLIKFSNITASDIHGGYGIACFHMESGSITLTDSKFNSCNVYCHASGTVTIQIYDTEIRNSSISFPGLMCSSGSGTITIDGVIIDGIQNCCGISADSNNTVLISNSTIKNCVYNLRGGAGITMTGGGNKEIYGTTVSGNTSTSTLGGGGVYVSSGNLTMNGCTISGNKASSGNGGGIYFNGNTFTLNNSTISNNIAEYGGGISVANGTFIMNSGTISGNKSTHTSYNGGGGVYVRGNYTLNAGTISDNTSSFHGGGVYVYNGTFNMKGGTISNNNANEYAGNNGGGVIISSTSFIMSGGTISGNKAGNFGGGIYFTGNSTVTKTGGTIYGSDGGDNSNTCTGTNSGHAVYYSSSLFVNTTIGPSDNYSLP